MPDELFATLPVPTSTDLMFETISNAETLTTQFYDTFCVYIRRRLNAMVALTFDDDENGFLCRQVTHEQIVISLTLAKPVLYVHNYARFAGNRGAKKLYQLIRKHMFWPTLTVDCYTAV